MSIRLNKSSAGSPEKKHEQSRDGEINFACPYCGAKFEAKPFPGGRKFQCGGCGKKFFFADGSSFKYGDFTAPVLPGMDRLICPGCGGSCDIARGTKPDTLITCAVCSTTFAVPSSKEKTPAPKDAGVDKKPVVAASSRRENLTARDKIRNFWQGTGMTTDEFRKLVIAANNALHPGDEKDSFDSYNDPCVELTKQILVDYAAKIAGENEFFGRVVEYHLQNFFANEESLGILEEFNEELCNLFRDEELLLSVLFNFVRSILRNDFVRRRDVCTVDLRRGFRDRIWRQAEKNYFPEGIA